VGSKRPWIVCREDTTASTAGWRLVSVPTHDGVPGDSSEERAQASHTELKAIHERGRLGGGAKIQPIVPWRAEHDEVNQQRDNQPQDANDDSIGANWTT
jgi:hypothetical protein